MASKYILYILAPLISSLLCGGDFTSINFGPRSSRHLISRSSTLSPIRLTYYYYNFSLNNQTLDDLFKGTLMSVVDSFFSTTLHVYSIEGNLISYSTCLSAVQVPASHKSEGVAHTDVLVYLTTNYLTDVSYVAYAGACETDQYGLGNILAGTVVVNVPNFSDNSMEEWIANIVHEMSHLLGFSSGQFDNWRDSSGNLYASDQVKKQVTVRGVEKSVLLTPNLLEKAKKAFNCSTIEGVELEDAGGSGTAGSHWDKRIMMNDYMTAFIPSDGIFSDVTLALFQDTGWYSVNYTLAQTPYFGRNAGCGFFDNKCLSNEKTVNESMWCDKDSKWGCDFFALNKGGCSMKNYSSSLPASMQYFSTSAVLGGKDQYNDYCPYHMPLTNGKCRGGGAATTFTFTNSHEVIGQNSRCFVSTLMKKPNKVSASTTVYAACYEVLSCNSTRVTVKVGNETVYCPYDGSNITLSGWNGWFVCPKDYMMCSDVPCKSYCYARGSCSGRGVCDCFPGYGGDSCNVTCEANCNECSNTKNCTGCVAGFYLLSDRCCPEHCSSCNTTGFCASCESGYKASAQGTCAGCSAGYYSSGGSCLQCAANCQACSSAAQCAQCDDGFDWNTDRCCPSKCSACDASGVCSTCETGFFLADNGKCENCAAGYYLSGGVCNECISNCATCENASACQECSDGYALVGDFCCAGKCNDCNSTSYCAGCKTGYYLADGGSASPCLSCNSSCMACAEPAVCDQCKDSNGVPDKYGGCQCKAGYFYSADSKKCLICHSDCKTCASKKTCLTCKTEGAQAKDQDYGCECPAGTYNDTGCKTCGSDCLTCDSASSCLTCKDENKTLDSASGLCVCKKGYYEMSDSSCSLCYESCKVCDDLLNCVECRDSNADPETNCSCVSGYYPDGISCYSCMEDCLECADGASCADCRHENTFGEFNCSCDETSMEVVDSTCVCRSGYESNESQLQSSCSECVRWVQPGDIRVEVLENFFEIEVVLNSSLAFALSNISFAIVQESVGVLGERFEEFKINSNKFLIYGGDNNSLLTKNLTFNLSLLSAQSPECGYSQLSATSIATQNPFGLPGPKSKIKSPSEFGYDCKLSQSLSLSGLQSSGGFGSALLCSWSFSPDLALPSSSLRACALQVPSSRLQSLSLLSPSLTVTNAFNKSDSSSTSIQITQLVDISIDIFSQYSCSPSQKCIVVIDSIDRCSKVTKLDYQWKNLNDSKGKLGDLGKQPELVLLPRTLPPGNWTFQLNVKQSGKLIKRASVVVTMRSEKPRIHLDRSSGDFSALEDLTLNASLTEDPNVWTGGAGLAGLACEFRCLSGNETCGFEVEVEGCFMRILKKHLKEGEISDLAVKVTSSEYGTWDERRVQVNLVDFDLPQVRVFEEISRVQPGKVPLNSATRFVYEFDRPSLRSARWMILNSELSADYYVDLVPAKLNLIRGQKYQLELAVIFEDSEESLFWTEFTINSPPLFGNLKVSPSSGPEFETEFWLSGQGWEDDEEDFPLIYEFGYSNPNSYFPLKISQSNFLACYLPYIGEDVQVVLKVSDNLGDYYQVLTNITITNVFDSDIKDYYESSDIIEPSTDIPVVVGNVIRGTIQRQLYKTGSFDGTNEDDLEFYQEVYSWAEGKLEKFVSFSEATESFVDVCISLLLDLTSNPGLRSRSNFKSTSSLISSLLSKLAKIGLQAGQGEKLLQVIENLIELTDDLVFSSIQDFVTISGLNERINLLVLQNLAQSQSSKIKSSQISSHLSLVPSPQFQGFQYSSSSYSVSLPSSSLNLSASPSFSLGFMSTQYSLIPGLNSSHNLVSFGVYNVTESDKLQVNLDSKEILIEVPVDFDYPSNVFGQCSYLDDSNQWKNDGLDEMMQTQNSVLCSSSHLTTFAFLGSEEGKAQPEEEGSDHGVKEFYAETLKLPGFLLCICLFALYNVLIVRLRLKHNYCKGEEVEQPGTGDKDLEEVKADVDQDGGSSTGRNHRKRKHKKFKSPDIIYEEQDEKEERIIEEPKNDQSNGRALASSTTEVIFSLNPRYSDNFFLDQFHAVHILLIIKAYKDHAYLLTKLFFIFFISVLFVALYYDYSYRSGSADDFEDFLEDNLIVFNIITVLFTAGVVVCIKVVLFTIIIVPGKKKRKIERLILSVAFVLCFVLVGYLVSCYSNGFGEWINEVWVVCAIFSIVLEILVFDPLVNLLGLGLRWFYYRFLA